MSAWQPIETARKDGEEYVLVAWKHGLGISLARWVDEDGAWMTQDGRTMRGFSSRFSHWMPLPSPPEAP